MAQNIKINGVTYNAVSSLSIPLDAGGDNAVFPDTSDANATESDILSGKTAYVNGIKLTGTGTGSGGGSIVDLGTFNDETELITHVIMNQLPAGHYTFIMNDSPAFLLLERGQDRYFGTFHDSVAHFYYFEVSFYGEIIGVKHIALRDLMTDFSM